MRKFLLLCMILMVLGSMSGAISKAQETLRVFLSVPNEITVVMGVEDVALFADSGATVPTARIWWGQVGRGHTSRFIAYVKNTGIEDVTIGARFIGDIGFGELSIEPVEPITLVPNQVQEYEFSVTPYMYAEVGIMHIFQLEFYEIDN